MNILKKIMCLMVISVLMFTSYASAAGITPMCNMEQKQEVSGEMPCHDMDSSEPDEDTNNNCCDDGCSCISTCTSSAHMNIIRSERDVSFSVQKFVFVDDSMFSIHSYVLEDPPRIS